MSDTRQNIGRAIKLYARLRGITMTEAFDRAGMHKQAFYSRARGETAWTTDDLEDWAIALGVSIPDLLRDPSELEERLLRWNGVYAGEEAALATP